MKYYIIQIGGEDIFSHTYVQFSLDKEFKYVSRSAATVFTDDHIQNDANLLNFLKDKTYKLYEKNIVGYGTHFFRYKK